VLCTRRAAADTAIRPVIFSMNGCSGADSAESVRERVMELCQVATIGPRASMSTVSDRLSVDGSCRCSTSNRPSRSQRLARAAETGPNWSRATEPL
jgi:hypothetical protein